MTKWRHIVERVITKQDYFHQLHAAEPDFTDPRRSYYYNLRARANYPGAFEGVLPVTDYGTVRFTNPIHAAQYGLAQLQFFWDSDDPVWLTRAVAVARQLVAAGTFEGASLVWRYPIEIRGNQNWLSAMAQGQAASFLLRTAIAGDDASLMEAARRSLVPFSLNISDGGVRTMLRDKVWLEEYAFEPVPYTLNGYIVALLGLYDAVKLLEPKDESHSDLLEQSLGTLYQVLPLFDAKGWSRYDLSQRKQAGFTVRNLASPFYHRFHLELLDIMARLTGNEHFDHVRYKWERGLTVGTTFYMATTEKIAYRLLAGGPFSSDSGRNISITTTDAALERPSKR